MTDDLARAEIEAMARAFLRNQFGEGDWEPAEDLIAGMTAAHTAASRVREERGFVVVKRFVPCPGCDGHECITECMYPGAGKVAANV